MNYQQPRIDKNRELLILVSDNSISMNRGQNSRVLGQKCIDQGRKSLVSLVTSGPILSLSQ